MSDFIMNDGVYSSWTKIHKKKFVKELERFLKEIKIQKEHMGWNRKRFKLLCKLEKDYDNLKKETCSKI